MTAGDFTYKPQDIDYLGFLEAQLRDMHGLDTLAYELVQNADDAKDENGRAQTTWIDFDVTDEALNVENDGLFRPVDFERLQRLAGGGKREELATTGAFGIGFVVVYQVTDAPEIFSSGIHWTIRPEAKADRRIQERRVDTRGTRFHLPWAFDAGSPVRRALRLEVIRADRLDDYARRIGEAVVLAALFVRQLQRLTVRRNGVIVRRIEREPAGGDQIILRDETGQATTWMLFTDDFETEASELRARFPWQIESKRRSRVRLALPASGLAGQGRLFAVLPTGTTTPMPCHINADFFPTTDRKRIQFDGGYQAEWNRAAIECAARCLARELDALPQQLGPVGFWQLLQRLAETKRLADAGELPAVFGAFWLAVVPLLKKIPIVFTAGLAWRLPAEVRLLPAGANQSAASLLAALGIPIVHPDLDSYRALLRLAQVGTIDLSVQDVADVLIQAGLARPVPLDEAPAPLRSLAQLSGLWKLIDRLLHLQDRPEAREKALRALNESAIVLTDGMVLERLNLVYRGSPEAQRLFPEVAWLHESVPDLDFPGRFTQPFGASQAVDLLAGTPRHQLEQSWRLGRLDLPGLFRWLESQQIEIFADDPALAQRICRLPLCPVAGNLRPLADLYIPGGFADPLGLAGTVNMEAIGGRRQFLRDLGVRKLDFDTYVRQSMPRLLTENRNLPSDGLHRLVRLLAERLGQFRDDEALREQLSQLPLVACMDGSFRPATGVYASREVSVLLGEEVHIAEPAANTAVAALQRWLGVRDTPAADDIVHRLVAIGNEWGPENRPLDDLTRDAVWQCWQKLDEQYVGGGVQPTTLAPLLSQPVILNQENVLCQLESLYLADWPDLAARFTNSDSFLLPGEAGGYSILTAIGVRRLSQAVQLQVVGRAEGVDDAALGKRIAGRRQLIERVLAAEDGVDSERPALEFLDGFRVVVLDQLRIQYHLPVGSEIRVTPPEAALAKLVPATSVLYVTAGAKRRLWAAVAREIAAAVGRDRAIAALATGIKEVLAAETAVEAEQILDELGYP